MLLLSPFMWIGAESYTKKRARSTSTLKNECCDASAQLLHCCTDVAEDIAKLQRQLLLKSQEILENDSKSFFARSKKEQLQECLTKIEQCKDRMDKFKKELEADLRYIISLN